LLAGRVDNNEATFGCTTNQLNNETTDEYSDQIVPCSKKAVGSDGLNKSNSKGKFSGSEIDMLRSKPRFCTDWMTRSDPGPSYTKQNAFDHASFLPGAPVNYDDLSAHPNAQFLSGSMTSTFTANPRSIPLSGSLHDYEDSFLYDCHKLAKQTSPNKFSQHQSPQAFNYDVATNNQFPPTEDARHTFAADMGYENTKEPGWNARKRRSSEITREIMPLHYMIDEDIDVITSEDAERLLRAFSDEDVT
jgi:hypothetical protein